MVKPSTDSTLHRIPERAKIAGVCAGVAHYLGLESWQVRLAMVFAFFLTGGGPALLAYIIAWFILEPKSLGNSTNRESAASSRSAQFSANMESKLRNVKDKVFSSKAAEPKIKLNELQARFDKIQKRIQSLEAYVTSKEFTFERELAE